MAERYEVVVSIVDYNGGLSWRFDERELEYWFKRLGIEGAKREMHAQLAHALEIAEASWKQNERQR